MEVVGYDGLIPSCSEDGGGVDLQELSGVDTHIVFLRQVASELARPHHYAEVWVKRHATTPRSRGCKGVSSLPHRCGVFRTEVIVEVVAPLSVAFDGDAAILTRAAVLGFGLQVSRNETCRWRAWCHWCAHCR
jgi:hypothetical protein